MRIVFCDDEPVFLDRIAEEAEAVLRRLGTEGEVIRCGSGGELMSILRQKSADAVFLDIDMPEMSGFEAADVIHGLPGGTEIIFIFSVLDPIRVIAMVTTKLLLFAFTRLILYLRHGAELSFSEFLPLILTPVFSLAAITILMPTALKNDEITNQSFTVIAIIIVMNVLIYYLFLRAKGV